MEEKLYTFQQLKEKFNWNIIRDISVSEQLKYAKSHGVNIEFVKKEKRTNLYVIRNDINNTFTKAQLLEKYGWISNSVPNILKYAENRGVVLKQLDFSKRPIYYEIINDSITQLEWKDYPQWSQIEVAKEGYVRNKNNKMLLGTKTPLGYIQCKDSANNKTYMVHRIVLETYDPIENMKDLFVDHIDGNRAHNAFENLRWASHQENMEFKTENWQNIDRLLGQIIKKIGYEETYNHLKEILNEANNY